MNFDDNDDLPSIDEEEMLLKDEDLDEEAMSDDEE